MPSLRSILSHFQPFAAAILFAMLLVSTANVRGEEPAAQKSDKKTARPNIILILADDLGWAELGCYGQQKIKTPNLDKLAAEGERWTQFYSGAPVCSPSRNAILTGRHTGGCNVQNLKRVNPGESENSLGGDWPMDAEAYTIHKALKKVGYKTSAFGKWGMGEYGTTGAPDKHAVDYFYGYTDHRVCHTFFPAFLWRNGEKDIINSPPIPGHVPAVKGPVDDSKYLGQKHASVAMMDEVLAYLDRTAGGDAPFFMYYCPNEPHVAMQPPTEWVNKYPQDWDNSQYHGDRGYLPHSRPRAAYAATISFLDDHVGKIMAKLKEKGVDDNTLVIFTSDNGTTHDAGGVDHTFFNSVADLRGLKGQMHEGGLRVPMIMRWPGHIKADEVINQPGYSPDIMPTVCSLVGANPGQPYGENLLPVVLNEQKSIDQRKPMVWAGGGYNGQVAVRLGDMKAIRRNLGANQKNGPLDWEVYDLANDQSELRNLAESRRDIVDAAVSQLNKEYVPANGYPRLNYDAPESGKQGANVKKNNNKKKQS